MPALFSRRKQRVRFDNNVPANSIAGGPVTVNVSRNSSLTTITFAVAAATAATDPTVLVYPPDFNDIILAAAALPPVRTNAAIVGGVAVQVNQYDVSALTFVAGDVKNNNAGVALTIISDWFLS